MLQTDGTCTIVFLKCYFLSLYNLLFLINSVYTLTAQRPPILLEVATAPLIRSQGGAHNWAVRPTLRNTGLEVWVY